MGALNIAVIISGIDEEYQSTILSGIHEFAEEKNINIASLHCDRNEKGGKASMYIALDVDADEEIIKKISQIPDVDYVTCIRKIEQ